MSRAKKAIRRFIESIGKGKPSATGQKNQATPNSTFRETALHEVAGCLSFTGKAKTLQEIDAAIKKVL